MTSDMAFECLLASRDEYLFRTVARILRDLSISIHLCLSSANALDFLGRGSTDLVVIDWEWDDSSDLLRRIWENRKWRKPTVVAISALESSVPGAHMVLKKPVTAESGQKSFKNAYSRMLLDYRRHVRHALMLPVVATLGDGRVSRVIVTDIGDGGVGLSTTEPFVIGDCLTFRLLLPNACRDILLHARVLWAREYGRVGCEFLQIPPVDLMILHEWLRAKTKVKKPRLEM